MPSPLAVDRNQVKATYLATGCLTETGKLHGIKPATIRQWAKRDNWPTSTNALKLVKKAEEIQQVKRDNGHKDAVTICHTNDALASSLHDNKEKFQSAMALGLTRAASSLTEMDDLSILDNSRKMVDLATAGKTIFGIGNESDRASLQVNVLQLGLDQLSLVKPCNTIEV
jgi:SOS-response transcriptional repressor LexA